MRKETKEKFVNQSPLIVALGVEADDTKETAVSDGLKKMLATLLPDQREDGSWRLEDGRPPLVASPEVMTTLAVLALTDTKAGVLGKDGRLAVMKAVKWLEETKATDDEVQAIALRLLLRHRLGKSRDELQPISKQLLGRQNPDGGWSQATGMTSDAYATGQALYALGKSGIEANAPAMRKALAFLMKTQKEDGSWPMTSRPTKAGEAGAKNVVPITHAGSAWGVLGLVVNSPETTKGPPADKVPMPSGASFRSTHSGLAY
jgi:squalene-hopene/tetraprenyl-beta-curcumene cyclase